MNICTPIIVGIILLLSVSSAGLADSTQPQVKVNLTLTSVCTLMAGDSKTFIDMHKSEKADDISDMLNDRFTADPALAYTMPGIMRILHIIEITKHSYPKIYNRADFDLSLVAATYAKCMRDRGEGWIQNIEGLAVKLKPHPPKVKI